MLDGISIIICCFNSGWIIRRTLAAIKLQQLRPEIQWEVILVDNCCNDNTVVEAQTEMLGSKVNFRIVEEKRAGLAYARRRGVNEVQYRYLIYCDDDNLLCPCYVQTMYDMFEKDEHIGAIGGKGIAEFCAEPEPYVLEHIGGYAVGSQARNTDVSALWGAGLALRTDIVRELYNTQTCYLTGRKGNKLLSGDDTELVYSIVARGYHIKGTDEVSYTHVLAAGRLTRDYFEKMSEGFRLARPVLNVMRYVLNGESYKLILKERYVYYRELLLNLIRLILGRPFARQNLRDIYEAHRYYSFWGIYKLSLIYWQFSRIKKSVK